MSTRPLRIKLEVRWDGANWTDESDYLISASGSSELSGDLPAFLGGSATSDLLVTLRNDDFRFSPGNTSGLLYTYIQAGKFYRRKIRLSISVDNSTPTTKVFTGYIEELTEKYPLKEVEIRALDMAGILGEQRVKSALYEIGTAITRGGVSATYTGRTDEYIERMAALAKMPNDETLDQTGSWSGGWFETDDLNLQYGTVVIPYAWADNETIWDEMVLAAEAECGRIYVNADGKLTFESGAQDAIRWSGSVAATYTVASFAELGGSYNMKDVYNKVVVEYSPWAAGPRQVVYDSTETWVIPAAIGVSTPSVEYFDVVFNAPVRWGRLYSPGYTVNKIDKSDYVAVTSGGADITMSGSTYKVNVYLSSGGYATESSHAAQSARVGIENYNTGKAAYILKFRLQGDPIVGEPTRKCESSDSTSISRYGTRSLQVPLNHYVQSQAVAQYLCDLILARCKEPYRTFTLNIPGVPERRVCDYVQITEGGTGVTTSCLVTRVDWTYGETGYDMNIDLASVTVPFTTMFVIGVNKWGGSGTSGYGRLWY